MFLVEVPRSLVVLLLLLRIGPFQDTVGQEFLPSPPADQTQIYILDEQNNLVPLPVEEGRSPLNLNKIARSSKTSYVELKGEHASVTLGSTPRLFLFTPNRQGSHPPFVVWLTAGHGVRRVTAISQAGLAGLAISSDEIVKPRIRVLATVGDKAFMELRPRTSLVSGEYAIIGDDLARIATFRVATNTMR